MTPVAPAALALAINAPARTPRLKHSIVAAEVYDLDTHRVLYARNAQTLMVPASTTKLLTEGTIVLGLAPMLWASGVGAEVIKPMAAPVLGGILIADEVIDLLLPVLFYWVRRWRWQRLQARAS